MPDESMHRPLEEIDRRSRLHDLAIVHDHDLVGEGQGLGLVMRDIDHGAADPPMQLFQLRAQHPFQMRVDDGQWLVEHDHVDIRADEPASERNLLLAVGGQSGRPRLQHRIEFEHVGDLAHALVDLGFGNPAVAQGECKIVVDRHRVIDDRELENLRDVALFRGRAM